MDHAATIGDHIATLRVLAGTRSAIVLVADVAERLGVVPGVAAEVIAEYARNGLVQFWPEWPRGPAVVLSVLAAEAMGLELEPAGRDMVRWVPIGRVRHLHAPGLVESDLDGGEGYGFDMMVDERAPDPVHDEPPDEAFAADDGVPRPRLLLGLRPAWPVQRGRDEPCPGCGGRRLPSIAACLVCDRTGVDHRLAGVREAAAKPAPKSRLAV